MCDKCRDIKFIHPRKSDRTIDYSRLVQCSCTKQPGQEYKPYTDNRTRDPYFKLLRRIQELEDAMEPVHTYFPPEPIPVKEVEQPKQPELIKTIIEEHTKNKEGSAF